MSKALSPEALRELRHKLLDNVVEYALDETGAAGLLAIGVFNDPDGGQTMSCAMTGTVSVPHFARFLRSIADDLESDRAAGKFRTVPGRPAGRNGP